MYFMECLILTVIQTTLGLSLGSLAHLIITKTEVRFLEKRDVTGFTLDPIIKEISIDPFAAAIIGSAAVLGIGYLFSAAMLYVKRRNRRRKKAGSLYMCISRVFRSKMVSVIQTLALTLICFGTLFGYLCYHNTTGFYSEDDDGNVEFYSNTDTKFGPAYQFDLEEDNIEEYYSQTAASYELGIGNLIFMRNAEKYFGVDDKTADTLGDCILTTTLSQTFIPDNGEKGLKHDIPLGSEEEKQFIIENSSSEGKALLESGKTIYRVKTKLSDRATIESLNSYVTSGSIDMDKLSSGEEILLVVKYGDAPYKVGESFTLGSATSANGFGIDKLTLKEVRVGAVIEIPKDMEQVLKYSVSIGDDYSLLTTATGAENIGLHDAKYNEIFAYEEIGSKLPLGTGMEVFSLSEQRRGMLIENASQFISMGLLVLLMSLLGFAAYFNGIGMKIRLKEYQISIMRAVGTPLKKLRRRLMLDSIKIPVYAAAIAYALTRAMQRAMEFANSNAEKLMKIQNKFANAENWEAFQSTTDREMLIRMQFLTGKQMWYVSALLPTVMVFAVMCIITIMITGRSFKMFTPDIASSLSKGRKRQ